MKDTSRSGNAWVVVLLFLLLAGVGGYVWLKGGIPGIPGTDFTPASNRPETRAPLHSHVHDVAEVLGLHPASTRSDADLAADIRIAVQNAPRAPKAVLDEATVSRLRKVLSPDQRKMLEEQVMFLNSVKGHRVLMILED